MAARRVTLVPASHAGSGADRTVAGRFCRGCGSIYPRFARRHTGKPVYGKDHVLPCSHEGETFAEGASWWEPAVRAAAETSDEPVAPPADS